MDFFQNPEVGEEKLTDFLDLMIQQYIDDLRYKDDLANPLSVRQESISRANDIESILRRTLKEDAYNRLQGEIKGVVYSPEELMGLDMESFMNIDPAQLPESSWDAYEAKLSEIEQNIQ